MGRLHVAPGIDAGAAGALADLLYQAHLEPIDIGVGEELVDALVGRDVLHEVVDHRRDGGVAAEAVIERPRLRDGAATGKRGCQQRGSDGDRASSQRHGDPPKVTTSSVQRLHSLQGREAPPERRYGAVGTTVSPRGRNPVTNQDARRGRGRHGPAGPTRRKSREYAANARARARREVGPAVAAGSARSPRPPRL